MNIARSTDALFHTLWEDYTAMTPSAQAIHHALHERGEEVLNDHIALRTFDRQGVDMHALAVLFTRRGWVESGTYHFGSKKLDALSLSHPDPRRPRVFISHLLTGHFSRHVQDTARNLSDQLLETLSAHSDPDALLLHRPSWPAVSYNTYQALLEESEYAAWLSIYGLRPNHFTVSINNLTTFEDLAAFNAWVTEHGHVLNTSGGAIKGSASLGLTQSSTRADSHQVHFACGHTASVPSCYVEFAQRHLDPSTGALFDRFITKSADKIFESTDVQHTPS